MDDAALDELERATSALIVLFLDGDNEGEHGGDHHDEDCPVCKVIADAQAALITGFRRPDHFVGVNDMVGRPAEWQPIGPEQRDGKPILAGSVNHECREIVDWQDYGEDGEGWVNTGAVKDRFYANPRWFTHYQPLPAAPKVTT